MANGKQRSGRKRRNKKNDEGAAQLLSTSTVAKAKPKTKSKASNEKSKLTFSEQIVMQDRVLEFLKSDALTEEFTGLTNAQRKEIHLFARQHGLKTRSRSTNGDRVLTISRKDASGYGAEMRHLAVMVKLQVSPLLQVSLQQSLQDLDRRQLAPISRHKGEFSLPGGGLVARPRVPRQPRPNRAMAAEQRQLPVYGKRDELMQLLQSQQVIIINGATGSGKSTQVPQFLLQHATDRGQPVRIVVSQPRRIAAVSVSGRIAEERGESLGDTVGYIIRMESQHSNNTVLSLTTSGCLLRSLAMNGNEFFANTTHLIIDEVHDRDLNTDFLLLAVKLELERNRRLKVILMSATMDLQALSNYFNGAPVLYVEGRSFNVQVYSLEHILHETGYCTPQMLQMLAHVEQPTQEQLLDAYLSTQLKQEANIDNALIVSLLEMLLHQGVKGAVIVYLPGYQDLTMLRDQLKETLPSHLIKVLLLHSQIEGSMQSEVFRVHPDLQLKIVLSTNIGQTSITIADLLYVIDTGRSKMKNYDVQTGASQLDCAWISQADAMQRTGRVGRRTNGICYRLYSSEQFNSFTRFIVPEMLRTTLDEICLLAKIAMPQRRLEQFLALALDPPDTAAVAKSCANLKLLHVLNEDESVTELGRIIAELPLNVSLAKCLVYSVYYRCAGSMCIIAAFYSVRDPFVLPVDRGARNEQRKARKIFSLDGCSDSLGMLQLYTEYVHHRSMGIRAAEDYCDQHYVSYKLMDLFVATVQTVRNSLRRAIKCHDMGLVSRNDRDMNVLRMCLAAGLYPKICYIDRPFNGRRRFIAEGDPLVQLSRNSGMTLCFDKKSKCDLSDWLIFDEKSRNGGHITNIDQVTLISTLMVALQCGKVARLEVVNPLIVETDESDEEEDGDDDEAETEADTDAEEKPKERVEKSLLYIDSWIRVLVDSKLGQKLMSLRQHLAGEFMDMVEGRLMIVDRCPSAEHVKTLLELNASSSGLSSKDIGLLD
ncbi:3'-5' RNA helicase YTHDC2 [Drosophila nasuta]|uniref:3'-5' RNA helicase YTHDC2 n=1 Tax=Drosophila nasuta TaxID=42062 RepID=UPI00295EAC00|nr:3'-5' RNA helicase YTHDC2 [Drosophila nasuta]